MNALTLAAGGAGSVPGWLVLGAALAVAVAVFVLLLRSDSLRVPVLVLGLIGLLVVAYALILLYERKLDEQALQAEEQGISARATALDGALAASGLACIDALAEMAASCEEVVFARPQSVAAARALVRARLMLLKDGEDLLRRAPSADLAALLETWRQPLARDPFGLVAVVLREDFSCPDDQCAPARMLGAGSQAAANVSGRRFETLYAAHQAKWTAPTSATPVESMPPTTPAAEPSPPAREAPSTPEPAAPPVATESVDAPHAAPAEPPAPTAAAPLPPARPAIPSVTRVQPAVPRPTPRPANTAPEPIAPDPPQ